MNKYIIEIEDVPFSKVRIDADGAQNINLYRAKGFNALVFDEHGLDKLTPLDKEREEAYQKGLEDGKARNENGCIGCRYDDGTTEHSPCNYCCNAYSNQWMAKEKTDKIVVGDEVKDRTDDCGVVTWIYGNDAYVLWQDGSTGNYAADELIKTGRHFNFLASLLNAMKEGAK